METPVIEAKNIYGDRIRVRACGLCFYNNRILLVNHSLYGSGNSFWSPPGGGVEFGETAIEAVKREFKEETGLNVEVGEMLFMNEFIQPPLHAIEIFFKILSFDGELMKGTDPEFSNQKQIIREVRFLSFEEIKMLPDKSIHSIFKKIDSFDDILKLEGYISPDRKQ